MNEYGTLHQSDGRYMIQFERYMPYAAETIWGVLTDPEKFSEWYPFATGKMELKPGGRIAFDDGEGTTYEAVIKEFEAPRIFSFSEVDDFLHMELKPREDGCQFVFRHSFDDKSMAIFTAAGWHRCLDVFELLVAGKAAKWEDNAVELRNAYTEAFQLD